MSNLKENITKVFKTILFFCFIGLFIVVLLAASLQRNSIVCSSLEVAIDQKNDLHFLDDNDVKNLITNNGQALLINQKIENIDLKKIEERIEVNPFVENAEVFYNFDGAIKAFVQQKIPLFRVFNNEGVSYYISISGTLMPLSSKFTPRLLVASGDIAKLENSEVDKDLKSLVETIYADKFLNALISQVEVTKSNEFVLYSKIDGHRVELGTIENLEKKFKNLTSFYKKTIKSVDLEQYKTINLKYNGQVVCTKK